MIFQSLDDIVQAKVPLVLPDTCILLDILRSPRRDNVYARSVKSAKAIADAVNGGSVASIIAEQVHTELKDNCETVQKETKNKLRKLQLELHKIDEWSQALGVNGNADVSHAMKAVLQCKPILDKWISSSLSFPNNKELFERAYQRMMGNFTPSKQAKDSYKDCLVVETYLEVARTLRSKGYKGQIVFASSNTKEFIDSQTRSLQNDISQEFNHFSINYARSLHETRYRLGL